MRPGYFAAFGGVEYACTPASSANGVQLLLISDRPVDGFVPEGERYLRAVRPDECDAVGLRRETATFGRHQVFVLADDDSGVLIEYDGPNDPGVSGAREVERGCWRHTAAPGDLRNRAVVSTLLAL